MEGDFQTMLGELLSNDVLGAVHTDIDTILSVQKQIQRLAALSPDYANCPTNKRTNTKIGPKFAKALTTFNSQFGTASDGATITGNTLAALKSERVQTTASSTSAPPVSRDAQALVDLAAAQEKVKKAAADKAQAASPGDKAAAQAAVVAADAEVQAAAGRVVSTTDDPTTRQAAEAAQAASQAAVSATTPQQAADAAGRTASASARVQSEVQENPAAAAAFGGSLLDVLKRQYGLLPLWGWGLAGAGAIVVGYLLLGDHKSPLVTE